MTTDAPSAKEVIGDYLSRFLYGSVSPEEVCKRTGIPMKVLRNEIPDGWEVRLVKKTNGQQYVPPKDVPVHLKSVLPDTTPRRLHSVYRTMLASLVLPIISTFASLCGSSSRLTESFPVDTMDTDAADWPGYHGNIDLKKVGKTWKLKVEAEIPDDLISIWSTIEKITPQQLAKMNQG